MVYRLFILINLLISSSCLLAQDELLQYNLEIGEKYFLQQAMNQNTQTESQDMKGNVSLDIYSKIEFEIEFVTEEGNYCMKCRYLELDLNFFSPQSDLSISSKSDAFSPMHGYLNELEKQSFTILMSPYGEFLEVDKLDSIINSFFFEKKFNVEKHDLLIKTVKEAFGEEAIISTGNIALNVYNDSLPNKCVKKCSISFNAKPIDITNNFFYQKIEGELTRIQGIGVITELNESFELEEMSMETNMKGNQTYDYLFDSRSGWIIEGMSKQKVHSLSTITGNPDLPAGLRMPSFTESEYEFFGGRISANE